ncbi:MAG: hypothetical protein AB1898_26045 [Acidobacteriota bacterium]
MGSVISTFQGGVDGSLSLVFGLFAGLSPLWPLLMMSLATGIFALVLFRFTSNQPGIEGAKKRIQAHLIEIRLFKEFPAVQWNSFKSVFYQNLLYLKFGLRPLLWLILPLGILLLHLDAWFGHRSLKPGESVIVSVKLQDSDSSSLKLVKLAPSPGVSVETPALRLLDEGTTEWSVRVVEAGVHQLNFSVGDQPVTKSVAAGSDLRQLTPSRVRGGLWARLLHPGEPVLSESVPVEEITVAYPQRSIDLLGWQIHWLAVFFVASTAFAFALKGLFKVQL